MDNVVEGDAQLEAKDISCNELYNPMCSLCHCHTEAMTKLIHSFLFQVCGYIIRQ